jgi:hypothetical protein
MAFSWRETTSAVSAFKEMLRKFVSPASVSPCLATEKNTGHYIYGSSGSGYYLCWWKTLALPIWCCHCRHTECKSYGVTEVSTQISMEVLETQTMCSRIPAGSHWQKGYMSQWEWNWRCNGDPMKLEMSGICDDCKGIQQVMSIVSPRDIPMWFVNTKTVVMRLTKPIGVYHMPWMVDTDLQDLMFTLLDYVLTLIPFLTSIAPILPFGMRMSTLCQCIMGIYKLCLILECLTTKSFALVLEETLNRFLGL